MSQMYPHAGGESWGDFNPLQKNGLKPPTPVGSGFRVLALMCRLAMVLLAAVTIAQIAVFAWGLSMFEDAVAAGDYDRVEQFDDLDQLTSIAALVLLVIAGVTWMAWQYRLARSAQSGELTRGPGWHAFAWITPIVGLWFPYQNIRDLWRRRFPERGTALLGWWWAGYLVTNLLDRVILRSMDDADTLKELKSLITLDLISAGVSLGALILAVRIHRALSDAERVETPVTPVATPVG